MSSEVRARIRSRSFAGGKTRALVRAAGATERKPEMRGPGGGWGSRQKEMAHVQEGGRDKREKLLERSSGALDSGFFL